MSLFTFIIDLFGGVLLYFYQVLNGFWRWLGINDFSGKKRRQRYLDEAPESFSNDQIPVVIAADDHRTFLYTEDGYVLQNRQTKSTTPVPKKFRQRFVRKGVKALRSLAP